MALQVPSASAQEMREILRTAVSKFDRDFGTSSKLIRELPRRGPQAFYEAALEILADHDDSRGVQCLIAVLIERDLLLSTLSDPSLTREQAIKLARTAASTGVMIDVGVARHLAEHGPAVGDGSCPPEIHRLMDVLAEISDGVRILPSLMALTRVSNPYLQSKAVLMIGRLNHSVKWVQSRLGESDSRVRANAVEALWGVDTEEARNLLRSAARDGNNRVAGNALVALHRLGDCWAIPELLGMASHESRRFRATAAWVMGETGDPRFTKVLGRLVGEPHAGARTRAFAALGRIKAATLEARQAGEWRVIAHFQQTRRSGWRELQVEVCSLDGCEQIKLLPTQFVLAEDAELVTGYSVEERPAPGALAVAFVFPRTGDPQNSPFLRGALASLAWKRPSDLWSAVPYIATEAPEIQVNLLEQKIALSAEASGLAPDGPLLFTCEPEQASGALVKISAKVDCTDLWSTVRRAVQIDNGPARGQRHLIVYGQSETGQPAGYPELVSAALASHITVHAISLTANSALENLCQTTTGVFRAVASESEVPSQVEETCLRLLARYTVRYQPSAADASSLAVRVQSPGGWGETTIPIPATM